MGLGAQGWGELGAAILSGETTPARACKDKGVTMRAYGAAVARLATADHWSMGPMKTGPKKGTKLYKKRDTTQEEDAQVEPTVMKLERRRGTTTANKVIKKMGLQERVKRRTMARRIKEAKLFASKGWNKKSYTELQMKGRLAFAEKNKHVTADQWSQVAFVDEHDVPHVAGEAREQALAMKKKHVYKKRGTPYTNKHSIPKGKNAKKGWGPCTKFCTAIMKNRVLVCQPVQHYIRKAGPPPPRPPQPKTAKGKPKGRRRTRTVIEKEGSFCSRHWGLFIEDVAAAARKLLPGKNPIVTIYQDNLALHKARPAQAAAAKCNVRFWEDVQTDSPDKNPIENVFSWADEHIYELECTKPAKTAKVTNERFMNYCRTVDKGVKSKNFDFGDQIESRELASGVV